MYRYSYNRFDHINQKIIKRPYSLTYNQQVKHGAPEETVRHVGDLGNIKANAEGVAQINITDTMISLSGPNSILGRAFVVHSQEDDLGKGNSTVSQETGNAGDRWACGVVGIL